MTSKLPTVSPKKGEKALLDGKPVIIESVLDLNLVQVRDLITGQLQQAKIQYLKSLPPATGADQTFLTTANATEEAENKKKIIEEVLKSPYQTRKEVETIAAKYGFSAGAVYRWIRQAREEDDLKRKQRFDAGTSSLGDQMDQLIERALSKLGPLDRTPKKIKEEVDKEIENATPEERAKIKLRKRKNSSVPELLKPSIGCIKRRLRKISPRERLKRTHGSQAAKQEYDPALGHLPNADFPFALWQIDYVLLDIIVVDDVERKPMCRPWLTIAIDPDPRTIPGFDLSLDPPGSMSTGNCVAFSILPKEKFLEEIGSTGEWPIWGIPGAIHGDNAFRLNFLKKFSADTKLLDLIWRPVKNPRFGGHIERMARTLGESIHFLPGTTQSDPKARGIYDSNAKATFTESELKQWLVERILLYHAEKHSALGMSPMKAYYRGVFKGTATTPPVGLQPRIVDPDAQRRLQLDLMPYEERTIQRYGVEIHKIFYWHDCLRRWINAPDPMQPKRKRKFIFRKLKPSLKSYWFYDPDLDEYYEIPTRDPSFPEMSIWDLQKVRAKAKEEGIDDEQVDEKYIKERYGKMREIEDRAGKDTAAARRAKQRRRDWGSAPRPGPPKPPSTSPEVEHQEPYERVSGFTEDD